MLKLKLSQALTGVIDGTNKVFTSPDFIALVESIVVDGKVISNQDYRINRYTLTLLSAPTTSIVFNCFIREELDIAGEGTVLLSDLINEAFEELGREQTSDIYKRERVIDMIGKSINRITNKTSEKGRVQHYALRGLNGLTINSLDTDGMSGGHIQGVDVEGAMFAGDNIYLPYTGYDGVKFTTQVGVDSILNKGDKALIGHRIPYGVLKLVDVRVNGTPLTYCDNQSFNMNAVSEYTIVRGKDGSQYLFLPYSDKEYNLSVKYVPDRERLVDESATVDIPWEYTSVIVYDVMYRILPSREDDRIADYRRMLFGDDRDPGLLKEYRNHMSDMIKKTRGRIRNAPAVTVTGRNLTTDQY